MQELKKIEQRKKEREKKALDLQKLITAADSNIEARRPERKTTKKAVVCRVKDTNVSCKHYFKFILPADGENSLSVLCCMFGVICGFLFCGFIVS